MDNIIFLDIDGCLSSEKYFRTNLDRKGDSLFIDPEKVNLLNTLKDIPGITIVISSSWREDADGPLTRLGLEIPISGHTDHYYEEWLCRGNEIEKYLQTNYKGICTKYGESWRANKEIYNYVIIDDDEDMLFGQKDNFIHINSITGITKRDINKIRKILQQ